MAILPVGIGAEEGNFQIERSLRFNSADSAYLSRTPASAGNRKTWTWSGWVKRGKLGTNQDVFTSNGTTDSTFLGFRILNDNTFSVINWNNYILGTTQVFRDPSAWYHFVVILDTTQATASNRLKVYVNGVQITAFSVDARSTQISQNSDQGINNNVAHNIGRNAPNADGYCDFYLTEVNFIDGSALDPTSFGEFNSDTGVWQPKAYTGSYGTNGFYLDFADNSSTTALGYDAAGSNDWTPNNFSVTAGAGNDSLVDTPTNYGTDTGAGGEVRGNYATLNPLDYYTSVPTNGNLDFTTASAAYAKSRSTIWFDIGSSDGWYAEFTLPASGTIDNLGVGVADNSAFANNYYNAGAYGIATRGAGGSFTWYKTNPSGYDGSTSVSQANGQVVGIAVKNGKVYFSINNSWILSGNPATETNPTFSGLTGNYTFFVYTYQSNSLSVNFGQRPFAYTAPSGFKALCTQNLPEPTVVDGGEYFQAVPYQGNSSTQTISGVGFQPDFTWLKGRSYAGPHKLFDAVRGATKSLSSNLTDAEVTDSDALTAFTSDGFSLGADGDVNRSADGGSHISWNWKANGSGVSNTDGTITSTVSANTTAGFSVVTYTGNGTSGATVGHGLGVAPDFIILKNKASSNWWVYPRAMQTAYPGEWLYLNLTLGHQGTASANDAPFYKTNPTGSVFYVAGDGANTSSNNYVAYCFAPVAGYSAFGSYTGNGSTDGPMIFTGFRPRFVMIKGSSVITNWTIVDTSRDTYNVTTLNLRPNSSAAETTDIDFDLLSNGFKIRGSGSGGNNSGSTYIYMAVAESPFKYSLGV